MKLVIATKNQGKVKEFKNIFKELGLDFDVVSMSEYGIDLDIEEDADTFEGNAKIKAEAVMKACGEMTIADDSGLVVDALNGEPGVYSARYSGENATDLANNLKLLKNMEGVTDRRAHFVCAIAVAFPNGEVKTARGEFHGEIDYEMKGQGGFGYDVLFYLPEYKMTSAEIPSEEKDRISHRYKALKEISKILKEV